jgi:4-hydroxybenzoate polyprenyltransferase/phosphoserine phosphatase
MKPDVPLCVDLDGTLIKTDILLESVLGLLKTKPSYILLIPLWLLKGKAFLKKAIADSIIVDVDSLPYHSGFLEFLHEEHRKGRKLVLVTATDIRVARQIASHLGIFSEVIASNGETNLSGKDKVDALDLKFGRQGYDYAADSYTDLKVWAHAHRAILVNACQRLNNPVRNIVSVSRVFNDRPKFLPTFFRAIRVHQWAKNALVFVPLIVSHNLMNPALILNALLAFLAFSLSASSAYLLNDLIDLETDRHHPTKRHRPFAAGDLSLKLGYVAIPCFFVSSLVIGLTLSLSFVLLLFIYLTLATAYSFYFKQFALVDVILLAGLYTLRIYAGGAAISVELSEWLLAFSMFTFLSLALLKRFSELRLIIQTNKDSVLGRGYGASDLGYVANVGLICGCMAVLVLALYISSKEVTVLYKQPDLLWLICPMMLYWITRAWLLTNRGQLHEDPLLFALMDRKSYVIAVATGIIMILASK